jgi:subtilase family serine protease
MPATVRSITSTRRSDGSRMSAPIAAWRGLGIAIVLLVIASGGATAAIFSEPTPTTGPGIASGGIHASSQIRVAPAFSLPSQDRNEGPLSPGTQLTIAVGVASQDPSGLAAYLRSEYAGGTPRATTFLSPSALAERFGASEAALSAARAYFEGEGLSVNVSADRLMLFASGPSNRVATAFSTSFDSYRTPSGAVFFDHPEAAVLPAIAPWTGAMGLGDSDPIVPSVAGLSGLTPVAVPASSCNGSGFILIPCQVWTAYNLTELLDRGDTGAGVRIGVVDAYTSLEDSGQLASDLAAFDEEYGLPPGNLSFVYPVPSDEDLNTSGENPDWTAEDALDLEWARAAAPSATIDMTFSPNAGVGLYEAVDWLVAHDAVNVLSMSWGEPDVGVYNAYSTPCSSACNASSDGSYAVLSPVLEFAAAEGISVFAASGDCGAADGTSGVSTNYPASDPSVTGVGGTVLSAEDNGTYVGESGWSGNDSGATPAGCSNQGGSGGGYSPLPRPWWQLGLPSVPDLRGVPDVAMVAGTPATIVLLDRNSAVEGTSLATPIWAGITADMDESVGQPLGFLNPALYWILNSPDYGADFHEITTGNNGYPAGPGWNPVTGIGTPIVSQLVTDLTPTLPRVLSSLASTIRPSVTTGATPLPVSFQVGASGGTGVYPRTGVYFDDGNATSGTATSYSHAYLSPGVYAPQSYVFDTSGNESLSEPAVIVAGGGHLLGVQLVASNVSPAVGVDINLSAQSFGGVGPLEFSFFFGDGTYLNNTTVPTAEHAYGVPGSYCAVVIVSDSAAPVDGGRSAEVGIGVGGFPVPLCSSGNPPISVAGSPTPDVGAAPLMVTFSLNITGGTGGPYSLDWPSGAVGSDGRANASFTYASPGVYRVTLRVSDAAGDMASFAWNITVGNATPVRSVPVPLLLGLGGIAGAGLALAVVARGKSRPPPAPPSEVPPSP